jgi:4-alpha-glucanotransferase
MFGDTIPADHYNFQKPKQSALREFGTLLHISSLPGKFASGDLGEEAYRFVDFLKESGQSYWQTLPLSPVTAKQSWSPYSSPSAFAGTPLFISPEKLQESGLLKNEDLEKYKVKSSKNCDFESAHSILR